MNSAHAVIVGHDTAGGKLTQTRDYAEACVHNALERTGGLTGATIIQARGITDAWGDEDCTVVLLIGSSDHQATCFALEMGQMMEQEQVGVLTLSTLRVDWLETGLSPAP